MKLIFVGEFPENYDKKFILKYFNKYYDRIDHLKEGKAVKFGYPIDIEEYTQSYDPRPLFIMLTGDRTIRLSLDRSTLDNLSTILGYT